MIKYFHEREGLNKAALTNPQEGTIDPKTKKFVPDEYNITLAFMPFGDDKDFIDHMKKHQGNDNAPNLFIPTGADEITWSYGMNMKKIPTYGGENVQILSTFADKMTIRGTCRNYGELMNIASYFRWYMLYTTGGAGKQRHQKYLTFKYPARDWSFIILVTSANNIRFSRDIAAPEWSITAEIVSENDRYALGQKRIDQMASVLKTRVGRSSRASKAVSKPVKGPVNFDASFNPFGDLVDAVNGRRGAISDNFESLTASWATGSITQLQNNPLVDPPQDAQSIYEEYLPEIGGLGGGGGGATGGGDGGGGGDWNSERTTLEPHLVAALAQIGLEEARKIRSSIPASWAQSKYVLSKMVRIAKGESSYTITAVGHNYSVDGVDTQSRISYDDFTATYSKRVPKPTATSKDQGNLDIGVFQMNNYWHPDDTLEALQIDTSGSYDDQRQRGSDRGAWSSLINPIINATVMGLVLHSSNAKEARSPEELDFGSWLSTKDGNAGYAAGEKEAEAAVEKFWKDREKYKTQVRNLVQQSWSANQNTWNGGTVVMTESRKEALAKIRQAINNGTISIAHPNDAQGLKSEQGVIIGNVENSSARTTISTEILKCIVALIEYCEPKNWNFEITCIVGTHYRFSKSGRQSRHWTGHGLDIFAINGKQLLDVSAKTETIQFMQLLNNLTPKPNQIIMYGNGKADSEVNQYELNGNIRGPEGYDSGTHNGHDDHIHIGY